MDNSPGSISLGNFAVTTAATQIGTPAIGLAGMNAVTLLARFIYGSGGTTATVYFQTSFDQGQTWCDIASVQFATSSQAEVVNVSGLDKLTTWTAQTDGTLTAGTVLDGPLGDQLRVKVVSAGTYGNSTLLSTWAVPR
jgi:hypothetical protein